MKYTLTILVFILSLTLVAQTVSRQVILPTTYNNSTEKIHFKVNEDTPFKSWFVKWNGTEQNAIIEFSKDGVSWDFTQAIELDPHQESIDRKNISTLGFIEPAYQYARLVQTNGMENIEIHFFSPGHTSDSAPDYVVSNPITTTNRSCPCPLGDFENRAEWCPSGNCPEHPNPSITTVTHLIVHHSAGSNTSSDWAGVVRSIWDFHVNGRGWSDIGYNWLIAPTGVIYQGRLDNWLGAHFCGTNGGTMGVCMMGTYTDVTPTQSAINSLIGLLSWKTCEAGIDPLRIRYHASSGKNLYTISGHRDGCATECPGNAFYPMLPDIRQSVYDNLISGCSGLAGPTHLEGVLLSPTEAQLNWTDNTENEEGYLLERGTGSNPTYNYLATINADSTSYTDPTLEEGVTYNYRLRAFTASDTSAYSNSITLSPWVNVEDLYINSNSVFISPNPFDNIISIEIENELQGTVNVKIFDTKGQLVKLADTKTKTGIHFNANFDSYQLTPGVYFLQVNIGNHTGIFKVLKM